MAFAMEDELTRSPIDIVELEGRDFTAAKSESREQKQDGEITATRVAAAIAALQKQPKLSK